MPPGQPRLLVEGSTLLSGGGFRDRPHLGNLPVAETFQKQQTYLFFGRGKLPAIELLVDRLAQPTHKLTGFVAPALRFSGALGKLIAEGACLGRCCSGQARDRHQLASDQCCSNKPNNQNRPLNYHVGDGRSFPEIGDEIDPRQAHHECERDQGEAQKRSFRCEVWFAQVTEIPFVSRS